MRGGAGGDHGGCGTPGNQQRIGRGGRGLGPKSPPFKKIQNFSTHPRYLSHPTCYGGRMTESTHSNIRPNRLSAAVNAHRPSR